jgi:tRNA (guanine-N7-)-methyltransferase
VSDDLPPDATGPRFYGRRHGRRLRAGRARLLETLLPALSVGIPAAGGDLDLPPLFPRPMAGYALEIGFGAGEHLAWQARANPDIGFLGCEPFVNGITTLLAEVETHGLDNIRIFPDDARLILPALPTAGMGRCFILFPDPWPKRRHRDRRIVNPSVLDEIARILADGGALRLASDHPVMVDGMLMHGRAHPAFVWEAERAADWRQRPADWPPTRYEAKALHGRPVFLTFRRIVRQQG